MNARASLWASLAIAASIGLAGCGGSSNKAEETGGDPKPSAAQLTAEQTALDKEAADARKAIADIAKSDEGATDDLVAALESAITDLNTEIQGIEYEDDTDKTNAEAALREARDVLSGIETAKTNTANKENADEGKATLENFRLATESAITGSNLAISATGHAATLASVTALKKTKTDVADLDGWKGVEYMKTTPENPTDTNKLTATDRAIVYTNQADAKMEELDGNNLPGGLADDVEDRDNIYTVTSIVGNQEEISADDESDFPKLGTRTYEGIQKFTGKYAGVSGTYECAEDCAARNDGEKITLTGGTWFFTPVKNAMVPDPDDHYLYFGWWMQTDGDGKPVAVSAFHDTFGTAPAGLTGVGNTPQGIGGSATYSGKAAGRFAIYDPQDKTGDAGHFTANVTLTAKFDSANGANDDGGVTGTVNGFVANGDSVPWLVTLNRAWWNSTGGNFGLIDQDTTTTGDQFASTAWSLDGDPKNADDADGSWSGTLYDDATGAATTGDDDGSNVPTVATGVFHSKFGATHEMVGGFGANLNN